CLSSKKHQAHDVVDIPKTLERKQTALMRDLQDLDKCIHPKYQEIASHTPAQKAGLNKTSKKLTASIHKHEQDFHREICIDIQNLKASRYEMDSKKKNKAQHSYQQIGLLSELAIKTKKHCYTMNFPGAEISSPNKQLINEPRIIKKINTKYKSYKLRSVSCQNDNIWTCGRDKVIRLFNLQGELVKSIQTEPVCNPLDIAVTRSGNLVYTDFMNKTVNIVKNTQIQTLIRLHGWKPRGVCSSSSWDLLVFMYSDDDKQTKVVCYSGSTEKKSIQYDDKGQPLYSSGSYYKYICENTNLDICVSDNGLRAVVVVNRAGKLRFTYTGPSTPTKESLRLVGIATDSLGRILTSDINNRCIHILDQDGQFLRYIDNCDLRCPRGLCVDTRDNLFVTEYFTGRLKKIQYKT
uniref:Tripartite motif-containing protein 2 n=1 Tax=Magallana gigas TaxID=29159 RepID=A0A8W8IGT1_MAGGI